MKPAGSIAASGIAILASLGAGKAADAADPEELPVVEVIGQGEPRQMLRLGAGDLRSLPGGTTVLKALERLPGVNFQSADPFGANEWSVRLTVRGFAQNQLGFTLDGVPLGDMSYANHNGLHASRAISTEDVREVRLSQGAGALGTASTSNLGGTVEFITSNPAPESGLDAGLAGGSNDMRRIRGRFDSGLLGAGTRFFVSAVDHTVGKWRGAGDQKQQDFTFKLVQAAGTATLTAFANYSDRADIDYQDLSFDLLDRRGYFWDNWAPDWDSAVQSAQQCADSGFSNAVACDDAYWNGSSLRRDLLAYAGLELPAGERVTLQAKAYLHNHRGQGLWATPYQPTPGGAPLSIRVTDFDMERRGLLSGMHADLGAHRLQAGIWYESNRFGQTRMSIGEPSIAAPTHSFYRFQQEPFQTQWQYAFDTRTLQLHLQDQWQVSPALRVDFGGKFMDVKNAVDTVSGPEKEGAIRARDHFLPQAGAVWSIHAGHELFASVTANMRAFVSAGFAGPFGTSAAGFNAIRDTLKPERSTSWEAGWRLASPRVYGSAAVYFVDYRDRLLNIQPGPIILGNPSVLANVGSVSTRGVELALGMRPARGLEWFNSLTLNDSTFDDDYTTNGNTVAVAGKRLPDAPVVVLRSEISYDNGTVWARLAGRHVGRRYYTYLNDGAAPAYTVLNAGAGIRLGEAGNLAFKDLSLQVDVTNITNKRYIATVGSTDFVDSDPGGTRQTLQNGAPRQYFVTLRSRF